MATTWTMSRIGTDKPGRCIVCGRMTGSRGYEMDETVEYTTEKAAMSGGEGSDYTVTGRAHGKCVGLVVKGKIGGGIKIARQPRSTVEA